MAAFYNDSSRKTVFAKRARQSGPLNGPETCQIDLLEWSPGMNLPPSQGIDVGRYAPFPVLTCVSGNSTTAQPLIETNAQALPFRVQPRIQIVYGQPFRCATLLMYLSFELCAFGYCPPWNRSGH